MRHDMFKVIVERPRRGVGYYRTLHNEYRAAKRFKLDANLEVNDEYCASKLPMRARKLSWDGKSLNENLNPLRRFLAKQVGRRWDEVYSEICANLDTGSTVKQHVRQHLTDFVVLKTFYDEDGELRSVTRWGIKTGAYHDFYVDPEGVLRGFKNDDSYRRRLKTRAEQEAIKKLETERVVDSHHRYVKIDGLWFFVTYEDLPKDWSAASPIDFWKKDLLGRFYREIAHRDRVVAVAKKSASHREIVKHQLY
jgi:hypothetical protein